MFGRRRQAIASKCLGATAAHKFSLRRRLDSCPATAPDVRVGVLLARPRTRRRRMPAGRPLLDGCSAPDAGSAPDIDDDQVAVAIFYQLLTYVVRVVCVYRTTA